MTHAGQEFALGSARALSALQSFARFGDRLVEQRRPLAHKFLQLVLVNVQIEIALFQLLQHFIETIDQGAKFVVDVLFGADREVLALADIAHNLNEVTERL